MGISMKKIASSLALVAACAHADGGDWVDVKVGLGQWSVAKPTGILGEAQSNAISVSDFNIQSGTANYIWGEFQHFLPIIPHIRVEYEQMPFDGQASTTNIVFGPYVFSASTDMDLYLDNLDVILFYDIGLFDDMIDLNYGIGAKAILGALKGTIAGSPGEMPMGGAAVYAYINANVELLAGLGFEIEYKWFPDGIMPDLVFTESIVKVDYLFDLGFLQLGAEAGYREMDLLLNSPSNSIYINMGFSGAFMGVVAALEF